MSDDSPIQTTHCPSCGTDLSERPPTAENTCPQCDRGLTLPEDAVKTQLCVFCKIHEDDADESVRYVALETGERLCTNCLADLRAFKFDLAYQVFTAEWLTDEHQHAINQALFEIAEEHRGEYTNLGNTNAAHARMGQAESPPGEIEATLEELDDEQRAELRDALEEADASEADDAGDE